MSGRRLSVTYPAVIAMRVDRAGNLRLYRRGRFGLRRQDIFHPASEWLWVSFSRRHAIVAVGAAEPTTPEGHG